MTARSVTATRAQSGRASTSTGSEFEGLRGRKVRDPNERFDLRGRPQVSCSLACGTEAGARVDVGRREPPQPQTPDRHPGSTGINPREEKVSAVPTYTPKAGDITRPWYVIDATDVVLGRLAVAGRQPAARQAQADIRAATSTVATSSSSSTPTRSPSAATSCSDKSLYRHSGYPGGLRTQYSATMLEKHARACGREGDHRHAAAQQARPPDRSEAQGLRGPEPPPHRAAADSLRDQAGGPVTERVRDVDEADVAADETEPRD